MRLFTDGAPLGIAPSFRSEMPETRAIASYLDQVVAQGEHLVFMGDIHGGTGSEDPMNSGANGILLSMEKPLERIELRRRFIDMMRSGCDYMNPEQIEYWETIEDERGFAVFAEHRYGALTFTFEIAQSKMWDRAAGRRLPNSQAGYRRFAEQFISVIVAYIDSL